MTIKLLELGSTGSSPFHKECWARGTAHQHNDILVLSSPGSLLSKPNWRPGVATGEQLSLPGSTK